jgi:uncharacterized membrane protein YkvA (DUF1232 family)
MGRSRNRELSARRQNRAKLRELLLFIPRLVRLLVSLLRDARVSAPDKAILAGTVIYVIAPIDIIPDFVPFIGQVDDAYLVAIAVLRLLNRADRNIVMEKWRGGIDLKDLVTNIARIAEFFLPSRLKGVLRGRIEPPAARVVESEPASRQAAAG